MISIRENKAERNYRNDNLKLFLIFRFIAEGAS